MKYSHEIEIDKIPFDVSGDFVPFRGGHEIEDLQVKIGKYDITEALDENFKNRLEESLYGHFVYEQVN